MIYSCKLKLDKWVAMTATRFQFAGLKQGNPFLWHVEPLHNMEVLNQQIVIRSCPTF